MQKAIVCNIDEKFLECGTKFSDRFTYSCYFIPLLITFDDAKTIIVPEYKKNWLDKSVISGLVDSAKLMEYLPELGLGDFIKKNKIELPLRGSKQDPKLGPKYDFYAKGNLKPSIKDVKELIRIFSNKVSESDRGILNVMERKMEEIDTEVDVVSKMYGSPLETFTAAPYETASYAMSSRYASGFTYTEVTPKKEKEMDVILNSLKSDIGYLFLDRTRIRPKGFAIGEHVYSLSLAPGEEVVLEQKTFSKKQMTYEEQTDIERQLDIELSSSYSTEIQEGFERQKSLTDKWGLSLSHTGQYQSPAGLPWGQITASHTIGYTKDVTEANTETRRRSVKENQSASSKVASKYRALHKTTFKISTEEGFESTSKRVIKNPNKYTPVNLHYFKILQALEMTQERYGVRLCWAPFIKDPAGGFFDQIQKGKDKILKDAEKEIPPKPIEPEKKATSNAPAKETKWKHIKVEADKWDWFWGNMRYDYNLEIPIDKDWHWVGDVEAVKNNVVVTHYNIGNRTFGYEVRGTPYEGSDQNGNPVIKLTVHVGASEGGAGAKAYIEAAALLVKDQTTTITDDTAFNTAMSQYLTDKKAWEDNKAKTLKEAQERADEWEKDMLNKVNPIAEMMNRFIKKNFPPASRDEGWEIDYWQKLFEWEASSYILYPSWWADGPMQDTLKESTHFFNASWARLYLPIKIGMEQEALRWIFEQLIDSKLADPVKEAEFAKIENDLKAKRIAWFGDARETNIQPSQECDEFKEKYLCLARWSELMPTDGTHIEVIQSKTSTVDDYTGRDLTDTADLRKAILDSERQNLEIKKKANSLITQPPSVEVVVKTDTEPPK